MNLEHLSTERENPVSADIKGNGAREIVGGTSGPPGVLEAFECPPAYGTGPALVRILLAASRVGTEDSVARNDGHRSLAVDACKRELGA